MFKLQEIIRYLKTCVFTHFASGQILFGQHLVNSKPLCSRREVFYLPLCKAQFDLLGSSGFCFTQNISVDVSSYVHITVTKMLRHDFQVDTAV